MLRICHLAKYYSPFRGGIETHVQSLARAQAAAGDEVTVACVNHQDAAGNDVWCHRLARTPRATTIDQGVTVQRFPKFATLARFDFCTGLQRFLSQADQHYDLLHLHVPNPTFCCALATVRNRLPLVVTYHSDIVKQVIIRKPFRIVESTIFAQASCFIATSAAYVKSSSILRRVIDRTVTIPFGLDLTPYLDPSPAACQYRDQLRREAKGMPIWLCVGRLVYYKGIEHAIRALPRCRGNLVIVGTGVLRNSLQSLALELGVADRVIWKNGLSDEQLIGAYHAATAFWFPSVVRSEAFGLVQIEAMASGCPVINTAIPGSGVPSVSLHDVSGLTVEVADASALAAAANRIDRDPSLRNRLSTGAVARAKDRFSLSRMTLETEQVYRNVLRLPPLACPTTAAAVEPAFSDWDSLVVRR